MWRPEWGLLAIIVGLCWWVANLRLGIGAALQGMLVPLHCRAVDVETESEGVVDKLRRRDGQAPDHVRQAILQARADARRRLLVEAKRLADQQVGPLEMPTVPAGPNHVTTNEANFPLAGRWTLTVTARFGEFDQVVFVTEVDVTGR